MPTARRTPVKVSGSADGMTTSRMTSLRVAPSARAASFSPTGAATTAAVVATAAGGSAASANSVIFGASSMPSQITSRKKYASGGSARRNVSHGSSRLRTQPIDPITKPSSTPSATPITTPTNTRRSVI